MRCGLVDGLVRFAVKAVAKLFERGNIALSSFIEKFLSKHPQSLSVILHDSAANGLTPKPVLFLAVTVSERCAQVVECNPKSLMARIVSTNYGGVKGFPYLSQPSRL